VVVKEIAVKKYVVKLCPDERERLESMVHSGKHPARRLTKAGIVLKADTGEAGAGWSGSQIAAALDTSLAAIARTRQPPVEEGFAAVPSRQPAPAPARAGIFDGAAEAKLIALTRSPPPEGCARWTSSLREDKAVELNSVPKASDNTLGRTLKNTSSNRI
jgi:hypothetical protein